MNDKHTEQPQDARKRDSGRVIEFFSRLWHILTRRYTLHRTRYTVVIFLVVALSTLFLQKTAPTHISIHSTTVSSVSQSTQAPSVHLQQTTTPNSMSQADIAISAHNKADRATSDTTACAILTPVVARQILPPPVIQMTNDTSDSRTSTVNVTSCEYRSTATSASNKTVRLTIHAALSTLGALENDVQFGSGKPANVETIPGYGQSAFWNSTSSQLSILKNDTVYIVSCSTGIPPILSNLSDVSLIAQAILKI
jgi:hypothetical protein